MRIAFLGVEWERKGGNIAIKVAEQLNRNGLETKLHIAGINHIPLKSILRL